MTVSVTFTGEVEQALLSRAEASGQDVESFVRRMISESLTEEAAAPGKPSSPSDFRQRLESWIGLHPMREQAVDDSRDSIYADRDR